MSLGFLRRQSEFISNISRRSFFLPKRVMARAIQLTEHEAKLCQLLLDTSNYIATVDHQEKPNLRITGGWVRDKLLGSTSHDIDIGIDSMTGYSFAKSIRRFLDSSRNDGKYALDIMGGFSKISANPEKSKHLETATTKILGFEMDFVNLRKEVYLEESRNPQMEFGTAEEDALRRDSTVNALFYNLQSAEVEDLTGRGFEDMELKIIKTPLPPLKTFSDDPLRVLRSIRFSSRLGFRIAAEDREAMSDKTVQKDFRAKVSRERVGAEVTKMLQGPDPHTAVRLIDELGLYNMIFTRFIEPEQTFIELADTENWHVAYNQLSEITQACGEGTNHYKALNTIAKILLRDSEDSYIAWTLTCFIPWARATLTPGEKPKSKTLFSPAAVAAREGLKADNKITKIIDGAVANLDDIEKMRELIIDEIDLAKSTLKRKDPSTTRETQGKAIRRWGSFWRSCVMYAILVHVTEAKDQVAREKITKRYAEWLSEIKTMGLLDVIFLKPMVNGNQVAKALDRKSGPWTKKALEMAMEWQLRNPDVTDENACIDEVIRRRKELDSI